MSLPDCIDVTLCVRLVQTLAHFLWQGAFVYLLLWFAMFLMRRSSSPARYSVSLLALLFMATCPAMTFILIGQEGQKDAVTTVISPVLPSTPVISNSASLHALVAKPPATAETQAPLFDWRQYAPHAIMFYIACEVVMLGRLMLALQGGRRLRRRSQPVDDPLLLVALARQVKALGLSFTPAIGYCRQIVVPTVIGALRPMILLPISLSTGLSTEHIEALLAHELAHIRRYDHLVNILQRVIEAILFFHPCVWLISRRVRIERENCCDDMVLAGGGVKDMIYADSLIQMVEVVLDSRAGHPLAAMTSVGAVNRHSPLRQRILRVIEHPARKPVRLVSTPHITLMTLGLAITLAIFHLAASGSLKDMGTTKSIIEGNVYILGHIKQPGIYAISKSQELTLMELITAAGGYHGKDIERASVTLTRQTLGGKRYIARKIGLITLAENEEYDVVLHNDDRISLSSGPTPSAMPSVMQHNQRGTVYILGQIKRPGLYALPENQDLTLMKLIYAAGSFNGEDIEHASITLSRYGVGGKRHIVTKLGLNTLSENAENDILLCSGDLVTLSSKPFYRPLYTVRLVVGKDRMTFQGQDATWNRLPAMLQAVPNRLYTVLCIAMAEDNIPTTGQLNIALGKASEIVDEYGFEAYDFVGFKPLGDQASCVQYVPIESMHYGSQKAVYIDDSLLQTHITDPPGRPQYAVRLVIGADRMTFQGQDVNWQQLPDMLKKVADYEFTIFEIAIASDSPPGDKYNDAEARVVKLQQQFGFERLKEVRPQPLGTVGSMTRYLIDDDNTTRITQRTTHISAGEDKLRFEG